MGTSSILARLVAVCAVTAVAGGALAGAPVSAKAPDAPPSSVATSAPVRGDGVTPRGDMVFTGLKIRVVGVTAGGRASVTVTGPSQRSRAARAAKGYSKTIYRSRTLRVVPGVYRITSRIVSATGGTDVPKVATKTLRVRKNKLTGFTARYEFVASAPACGIVGGTGPGGGKIFYVDMTRPSGSQCFEAAPNTWDGGSEDPGISWCNYPPTLITGTFGTAIGTGKTNTDNMVAECTSSAANRVRAYNGGSVTWSLPSKDELNALRAQSTTVGGFTERTFYWSSSSSESDASVAWCQVLVGTNDQPTEVKSNVQLVRPVRAF